MTSVLKNKVVDTADYVKGQLRSPSYDTKLGMYIRRLPRVGYMLLLMPGLGGISAHLCDFIPYRAGMDFDPYRQAARFFATGIPVILGRQLTRPFVTPFFQRLERKDEDERITFEHFKKGETWKKELLHDGLLLVAHTGFAGMNLLANLYMPPTTNLQNIINVGIGAATAITSSTLLLSAAGKKANPDPEKTDTYGGAPIKEPPMHRRVGATMATRWPYSLALAATFLFGAYKLMDSFNTSSADWNQLLPLISSLTFTFSVTKPALDPAMIQLSHKFSAWFFTPSTDDEKNPLLRTGASQMSNPASNGGGN